jgi:hypothetical protein
VTGAIADREEHGWMINDEAIEQGVEPDEPDPPEAPDELTLARDLVLRAHPETVAELVSGATLAELLASIPAAEAAYARIVAAGKQEDRSPATPVPGGGAVRSVGVNVDGLSPFAKIRAGLDRS